MPKRKARFSSTSTSLIVVAFVVVVGALSYVSITRLNSQVASTHTPAKTASASSKSLGGAATPVAVVSEDDLDVALSSLDATQVDSSSSDMAQLAQAAEEF